MEIKHGRAAMLGFLHIIAIEAGIRVPGYLSVSQDLKFSDVPAGCFASLEAVPTAGWLQIMVCRLVQILKQSNVLSDLVFPFTLMCCNFVC